MVVPFQTSDLLSEADHRIANHLALLMSYVRLKATELNHLAEPPGRPVFLAMMDGVQAQIAAVARLHRALVNDQELGFVDLAQLLREVCAPFASGLAGDVSIVEQFAPGCILRREQILPVSQIVAEVITNALKHAAEGDGSATVRVRSSKAPQGEIRIEVLDTGRGFAAGFDPEKDGGLGFRLVRGLSASLRAQTKFESTAGGLRVCLTLPSDGPSSGRRNHRKGLSS